MSKEAKHIELINQVAAAEGEGFHYDANKIEMEYEMQGGNSPKLAITVLTILGGILSSLLFTAFILIMGAYESGGMMIFLGIAFIAISIWLNIEMHSLLLNTFSISAFIIGYTLIAIGLMEMGNYDNGIAFSFILISIISLLLTQNQLVSIVAIVMGIGGILSLVLINDLFPLWHLFSIALAIWVYYHYSREAKIISKGGRYAKLYNPLRIGITLSFLLTLDLSGEEWSMKYAADYDWSSSPVIIVLVLLVAYKVMQLVEIQSKNQTILYLIVTGLILVPTAIAPGISGSLLVLLLSFRTGYKTGFAIGLLAFIYFISRFYYDLDISLLYKSLLLIASGILFLIFFYFTHKQLGSDEKI
jgi:hypothetical protein